MNASISTDELDLDALERRLDALEKRITRAEDSLGIANVINRYLLYFQAADCNGITANIDWDLPDVWSDVGKGRHVGSRPNLEFFDQRPALAKMPGAIVQHESVCKVIEVDAEGKTAKVAEFSPGFKCLALGRSQVWSMGKYYHDLVKVDGKWRIWHWHWFIFVEGEAAYGWLYQSRSYWKECLYEALDSIHSKNITVRPQPSPYSDNYRKDGFMYPYPEPPDAYATWDGADDLKKTRSY